MHAERADREQHPRRGHHPTAAPLGGERQASGDPPGERGLRVRPFGGVACPPLAGGATEQQNDGGKQGEGGHERHREPDAHHPPEVDDRLDAAEHQRPEADDGGERGVEAGPHHAPHRGGDEVAVRELGEVAVKLPVAHREVDVHRDGDDEHQGQEVRRDHRDLPSHQSEHPDHEQPGVEAAGEREHHPPRLAENQAEDDHEEDRHADPEDDEVVAHEGDHVVRDHRHPAEVQRALGVRHTGRESPVPANSASIPRIAAISARRFGRDATLRRRVEPLDAVQLDFDRGARGVVEVLRRASDEQPVALREQGSVMPRRRSIESSSAVVRASALTMTSANTGLASSSDFARARSVSAWSRVRMWSATAASEIVLDVVEQGDVEDAGDRFDAGSGAQSDRATREGARGTSRRRRRPPVPR